MFFRLIILSCTCSVIKGKELYNFLFHCMPDFCAISSHEMEERAVTGG